MRSAWQRRHHWPRARWGLGTLGALVCSGGLLLAPASSHAQQAQAIAAQESGHHHHRGAPAPISAKLRDQFETVKHAVVALDAPDTLRAEGYQPIDVIPTMGVHWINIGRTLDNVAAVDFLKPATVELGKIHGKDKVVGVAYAYMGNPAEAPDLFDGDLDQWHDHPEFTPPGLPIVMMHAWFVPSPDGPFAKHNPWLAYWAAGVEPPADSVMGVPATEARARQLALALGEAMEPLALAQARGARSIQEQALAEMQRGPQRTADQSLPPDVPAWREWLQAAIPRLNAARSAGNQKLWDQEADAMIAVWKKIRDAYIAAIPAGELRERVTKFYHEMETGEHG